ncbi:MAG: hypothetical protein Q7K03_05245 [Dehalococcoidia bacterium]|nr:hypothetical protein [Dehalococcoidia bacterium]
MRLHEGTVWQARFATMSGKKIFISGGGRCNLINLYATPDSY